jgi:hypothetical protein
MSENSTPDAASSTPGTPDWVKAITVVVGGLLATGIKTLAETKLSKAETRNPATRPDPREYAYCCSPDAPTDTKAAFESGKKAGYELCAAEVRKALRGCSDSELWGDHGLIAATMRCVDACSKIEDVMWGPLGSAMRGRVTTKNQELKQE